MKIKTSELERAALDWAVAVATGETISCDAVQDGFILIGAGEGNDPQRRFSPSTDWSQGGPLLERFDISTCAPHHMVDPAEGWAAQMYRVNHRQFSRGATPLIAAMRRIVAAKLGDTVDVPDELL